MIPSGYCKLSDSIATTESNQRQRKEFSLLLFVFLEQTSTAVPPSGDMNTTRDWGKKMKCVSELREMVEQMLQSQQKKFRQASHSVLNKLLCNYGTHIKVYNTRLSVICDCFTCLQTESMMRSVLPQLAEAVASIIRQSSNQQFQQNCRDILSKVQQIGSLYSSKYCLHPDWR